MNAVERAADPTDPWAVTRYPLQLQKHGERMEFCTSARTAPDHLFRLFYTLPAGKSGPPEHAHPKEDEIIEVVSGRCTFWVDGVRTDCGPGESCRVPAGARHRMRNPGPEPALMRVTYTGTAMEDVFLGAALARAGGTSIITIMSRMIVRVATMIARGEWTSSRGNVAMMRGMAWLFRRVGVRPSADAVGWDRT